LSRGDGLREFGEKLPDSRSRTSILNWILWWRVSEEEVQTQVLGYDFLRVWESARGISTLLLLLAALVTSLVIFIGDSPPLEYIEVGICAVLAVLIFFGYRWAMLAAMVFWTIEKVLAPIITPGGIGVLIFTALWWAAYMHIFYLAFRTELARRTATTSP
jgi:hypothetical protein